ncbi:SET domain-containing protein [Colletotrichum godetiae]|uniref:SET domain-containing protein n=1 Tax=Colletotrichum godetiae TaxID=1209918 RepID=A0AAJ0AB00_9PEZI|nr:SET domain-containing protein [Colletotrichum godetiae]KAK1658256.1 SET domain-containing protein [Colletotrichum godetiae]
MDELVNWAKSHGAALHPSVEVYNDPNTGNSFRVSPDSAGVNPGDTVVTCPLALTLSYLNATTTPNPVFHHDSSSSSSSQAFPPSFLESVPPHVISRFYLINQYLLGSSSFWHPYIRTLPQPTNLAAWALPPLWPTDDVELLEDTNAHVAIAEIKTRLKAEHKHALAAFGDWPARHDYTRLLYNWAYCIFTSRSFRPSLVIPAHRQHTLSLPDGCAIDDFSLLMPLFDVGNHSPTARIAWETSDDAPASDEAKVGLRTLDPYAPGAQVFNNYGTTKTNAELMLAYGFTIPESEVLHNDYVHVQKRGGGAKAAAEKGGDGGAGAASGNNKPKDYLISLRPVSDPSSVAARSGQLLSDVDGEAILPPFRHVQDVMVWELVLAQTTAEQRSEMIPVPEEGRGGDNDGSKADLERLRMILTGRVPAATQPLLFQTIGIIQHKVLQELERLDQSDFEMEEAEATRNQIMAYRYRRQCRKILENVLESMEMPDEAAS